MRWRLTLTGVIGIAMIIPHPTISPDSTGWVVAVSSSFDLVTVLAVVVACVLIGACITKRHGMPTLAASLGLGASLVIGSGLIGAWLIVQGLVGQFASGLVVIGVLVLVFAFSTPETVTYVRSLLQGTRAELARIWADPPGRVLIGLASIAVLYLMLTAMGPTTSWDGPMYHVDLPREFLEAGRIFLPPDNQHVAFIGSPQMLNAVFLSAGAESGPGLMQWVWFVGALLLMSATLARWVSPLAGGLTLGLVWAYPLLPLIGSSDLVDMAMAAAVLVAALVAVNWLEIGVQPRALFLGLLAGTVMAVKPQAAFYLIGLTVAVLVGSWKRLNAIAYRSLVVSAAMALLIWSPLAVKNAVLLDSPTYPLQSSPFVPAWVSEIDSDFQLSASEPSALGDARAEFNLKDWIFNPGALTPEDEGNWYGLPVVFLLGVGVLLTSRKRHLALLGAPAVIGVIVILSVRQRINLRYLAPVAPVMVMALAAAVGILGQRLSARAKGLAMAIVVVFSSWAAGQWIADVTAPSARAAAAIGLMSRSEWLQRPANSSEHGAVVLGDELHRLGASREAPALLLYESRGDLIDAPVLQDNVFMNWPILSAVLGENCPKQGTWELIVRSTTTVDYLRGRGAESGALALDEFTRFADKCLERVSTVNGYEIYGKRPMPMP